MDQLIQINIIEKCIEIQFAMANHPSVRQMISSLTIINLPKMLEFWKGELKGQYQAGNILHLKIVVGGYLQVVFK